MNIILKEKDIKKASRHVREVIKDLADGKTNLEMLAIRKGVTKAIDKYNGIQPHVELAKKSIDFFFRPGAISQLEGHS